MKECRYRDQLAILQTATIQDMPMPDDLSKLTERFVRLQPKAVAVDLVGYRSTTPQYATEGDILSGAGSVKFGGRWNPPGVAAVYASLSPETAMAETLAHFRYRGIPLSAAMPRIFVALKIRLSNVIDMTNGGVRQRLRISERVLLDCDWRKAAATGKLPLTQLVGHAAHSAGLEGLLTPSAAAPGGENLIVFPSNLLATSQLAVDRASELPKNEL